MTPYVIACILISSALLSAGKSDISDILILVSLIFIKFREFKYQDKPYLSRSVTLFIGLLFLISTLSLVQSVSILTSLQSLRTWVVILMFTSLSATILTKSKKIEWLVEALVVFSAALAITSLFLNVFNFPQPSTEINLIFPSFGHIRYAEFFLPFFPISIFFALDIRKTKLLRLSSVISAIFMFFTFSRASWLVIFVIPLLLLFYIDKKMVRKMFKPFVIISLVILVLISLLVSVWSDTKFVIPIKYRILNIVIKPLDLNTRAEYYQFSIKKLLEYSILGHGPGTFYFPKSNLYSGASATTMAHNHFFQKVYEIGYLGTIIYFSLLLYLYRKAHISTNGDTRGRLILLGVALSFIQAQMDFGWEIPIVYLINMLFIFAYQPKDSQQSEFAVKISNFMFIILIIWTMASGISDKSTSEKFSKLIKTEVRNNFKSSSLVNQWIALDKGNGRAYINLSGKEFIAGNYADSLEFLFRSVNSSMYQDVVSQKYLLRFLTEPALSRINEQSIFEILNLISKSSYPHDFFWVHPEEDHKIVFSAIDKLIDNKNLPTLLHPKDIAKIYYWKFTQGLNSSNYQIESYVQYIDYAAKLDTKNIEYSQISNITHGIIEGKDGDSLLKEILGELKKYPKKDIYISLGDLVYSNFSVYLEKTGDINKELQVRRSRIDFSHYGISYMSYARRLSQMGRQDESEKILSDCVVLYPDCMMWYKSALQ